MAKPPYSPHAFPAALIDGGDHESFNRQQDDAGEELLESYVA
jgi:hypothetical protein